jgi:hypothetical protein
MFWSLSKLNRIETGAVTISPVEVRALLDRYGVRDKKEVSALMGLAATSRSRQWWSNHKLSKEYQEFIAYEAEAIRISMYHALLVPGLLQTEDYAKAATAKIIRTGLDDKDVSARWEVRLNRQRDLFERMESASPPQLIAALDEAVLRRPVGGGGVMRRQLDHLLDMAKLSSIELIVVPLQLAGHPGLGGTFELLEFRKDAEPDAFGKYPALTDPDVLFVESAASDFVVLDPKVTAAYHENMRILTAEGWTGDAAIGAIRGIRESLGN